mgnify:CR=1 FL=1
MSRVLVTPDTAPVANSTRGIYDLTSTDGNPSKGGTVYNDSGARIYCKFYDDSTQPAHANDPDAGGTYGFDLVLADGEEWAGPFTEILGPHRATAGYMKLFAETGATVGQIYVMKDDS